MAQQILNDSEAAASFRGKLNAMFRELFGFSQGIQQLVDGATVNTDCSQFAKSKVILQGNRTLANPSNMQIGVEYRWYVIQDATGSRGFNAYGSYFTWANATPPVYSTAANAVDRISCEWDGIKLRCTFQKGFS